MARSPVSVRAPDESSPEASSCASRMPWGRRGLIGLSPAASAVGERAALTRGRGGQNLAGVCYARPARRRVSHYSTNTGHVKAMASQGVCTIAYECLTTRSPQSPRVV